MVDYNTKLLPIQAVSKELGISKNRVQSLIDNDILAAVEIEGKPYIKTSSLTELLGQKENTLFGQIASGYPNTDAVSCVLTTNAVVNLNEKAGATMECKGSISTLKDGRFMVQIEKGKTPEGKRNRESKGFRDEQEAQDYLEKRLAELNNSQAQSVPTIPTTRTSPTVGGRYTTLTFEEYALQMLNSGIGKATTRTTEGYRRGLSPVAPYIGKKLMTEITQQDLKKMFEQLRYKYVKSSMTKSFNTVRLVMEQAFDNGEIPTYPMHKLKCPTSKKPVDKNPFPIYSDEDIKVLFETSKEYNQEIHTMFVLLECTGMRPGEMRALEWSFFNAEEKTIRVRQAITTDYEEIKTIRKAAKCKEILSVTKSEYGVRTLCLSDLAVQALLDWRRYLDKAKNTAQRESVFIFPNRQGNFKSETCCQTALQRYRERCDVADIGVIYYKFRHTMCTRLILSGQPISVIQRIMGDNTSDVIMKIYTHVNEEQAMRATAGFYEDLNRKHANLAS